MRYLEIAAQAKGYTSAEKYRFGEKNINHITNKVFTQETYSRESKCKNGLEVTRSTQKRRINK